MRSTTVMLLVGSGFGFVFSNFSFPMEKMEHIVAIACSLLSESLVVFLR